MGAVTILREPWPVSAPTRRVWARRQHACPSLHLVDQALPPALSVTCLQHSWKGQGPGLCRDPPQVVGQPSPVAQEVVFNSNLLSPSTTVDSASPEKESQLTRSVCFSPLSAAPGSPPSTSLPDLSPSSLSLLWGCAHPHRSAREQGRTRNRTRVPRAN